MSQVLRTIAATFAVVGIAVLGFAVRADASPAVRGQEVIEYGATNVAGTGSATGAAPKRFTGVTDDDTLLDKLRSYVKNPMVPILAIGGVLILVAWKIALH